MQVKRLYRSNTNKVLAGVIGGIGEYFEIDPTILRLGFIMFAISTGVLPALIGYFFAIIIVPKTTTYNHAAHHTEHEHKKED